MFVIYYASAGMLLFSFFLCSTINIHHVAYELVLYLVLDIELAIEQEKEALNRK